MRLPGVAIRLVLCTGVLALVSLPVRNAAAGLGGHGQ